MNATSVHGESLPASQPSTAIRYGKRTQRQVAGTISMDLVTCSESPEERLCRLESENAELRARTAA